VVGVTVIIPVIGSFVLLFAIKDGIEFPVPDAGKPIAVFELVQLTDPVPALTIKFLIGTIAPSYTVVSVLTDTVGTAFTCNVKVVLVAHKPAVGVKVYTPSPILLTTDGLHVPAIPLVDVLGNTGTVLLIQIDCVVPKLNVGVIIGFTVTVNVNGVAHTAPLGVKI
jgi:hypothetical protein